MIVIEGMDNSGKSTLAVRLAKVMGMSIQESEGPPRSVREINDRVDRYQLMSSRCIFVRHPCVSNHIYGAMRPEGDPVTEGRRHVFYVSRPTLIYCDAGNRRLIGHVAKPHDTPEHLAMVERTQDRLLQLYRIWAIQHAHFIYRIGDDPERLVYAIKHFIYY